MALVRFAGRPGAVALLAAALVSCPSPARAHDPGLSSLDLRVAPDEIRGTLSLAASDARQVGSRPGAPMSEGASAAGARSIEALARASIALAIDGVALAPSITSVERSDAGVAVTVTFNRPGGSRLRVQSSVPARLAIGHRELLTVRARDGRVVTERMLAADSDPVDVELGTVSQDSESASAFLALGFRHILGGYDHLLFLLAILLGVRRLRSVITTVTAFTLAHSVTLSLAVLGAVAAPAALVEPLIAASIVFVGIENLVQYFRLKPEATQISMTEATQVPRAAATQVSAAAATQVSTNGSRWRLTFVFGLVHGFGFAGALRDLGVGDQLAGVAVPLACFNGGVEVGQMLVVLAVWPMLRALNRRPAWQLRFAPATSMAVAAAGCYWLIERTML